MATKNKKYFFESSEDHQQKEEAPYLPDPYDNCEFCNGNLDYKN
jgi:hypothetical protein